MDEKIRTQIFARLAANNAEPTTELEYASHFQLLIAVILSAQATDKSVNKATKILFSHAPDPKSIVKLGQEKLEQYIQTIGLYRNKAKNILATCQRLIDDFDGQVPNTRTALESLPGVGRKTANVILNTVFGQPVIAVDTHIFRVANRTGLAPGKTVSAVEQILEQTTPSTYKLHAHHWLILHGRYICKAQKPDCSHCTIADLCEYPDKTITPLA